VGCKIEIMTTQTQAVRTYEHLHFAEYLDGGIEEIGFFDLEALKTGLFLNHPVKKNTLNFPIQKKNKIPKKQIAKTEKDWLLSNYSYLCQQLLGHQVAHIEYPGGSYRTSCQLILENGQTLIATRRSTPVRSRYESLILQRLEKHNAPIPQHYAYNGLVLLQEDIQGIRLSEALENATEKQYESYMHSALNALSEIHQIADKEGLDHAVPIIGCERDWLIALLDRTAIIGNHLNIPCPSVPVAQMFDLLLLLKPRFIKWDARPGNAILCNDGNVKWFDWEHCCARNRIDDIAWLLCDDSVPDYPETEERLIEAHLHAFADERNIDEAFAYLNVFGVHHCCVRLARLLDEKRNRTWHDVDINIKHGQSGLALKESIRLCKRASRWSRKNEMTAVLGDWFLEIAEYLKRI